jgi:hypothetical protein
MFSAVFFSSIYGHQSLGSGLDSDSPELLDPDSDSMNPNPQQSTTLKN